MKARSLSAAMIVLIASFTVQLKLGAADPPERGATGLLPKRRPGLIQRTGWTLDQLERRLEQFGTITMSAPLLVPPNPDFAFDFKYGATNYFSDARNQIQGQAATSEKISQFFS